MRTLSLCAFAIAALACQPAPTASLQDAALTRDALDGPYVAGVTETFSLNITPGTKVRWSATSGQLSAQNEKVQWTLVEGLATLTASVTRPDGTSESRDWSFSVERESRVGVTTARDALLAAPISVLDGGVETSGAACDLAYDTAGAVHLAFTTSTHPSIFYGKWNGTSWSLEFVDGLGFNVGGRVDDTTVQMQVEGNGTVHILYVRSTPVAQLWYATKSGATWTRERVDSDLVRYSSGRYALALNPAQTNRPYAVYTSTAMAGQRIAVSQRSAANTWTIAQLLTTPTGASSYEQVRGDAIFANGFLVFPVAGSATVSSALFGWTPTGTTYVNMNISATSVTFDTDDTDIASAGGNRLLLRSTRGVYDFTINTTFTASTYTWSASTIYGGAQGDVAWNGTRPVLMQNLNGSLELATPNVDGYWLWTALGTTNGVTGAMALHPTTGVANICYQSGGRIMFQ